LKVGSFAYINSVARVQDRKDLVIVNDDKTKVLFHFILYSDGRFMVSKGALKE
jgi:hypothetical protein